MQRACDRCAKPYEAKRSTSRYCSPTCNKLAHKAGGVPVRVLPTPVTPTVSILDAVLAELTAAGRQDTSAGRAALSLAAKMDESSADSLSSRAAADRQLSARMVEALKDAPRAADRLDEIAARRAAKFSG